MKTKLIKPLFITSLVLSIALSPVLGANTKQMDQDAKTAIKALFPNLFTKGKSLIKTKGCKFQKEKWALILLSKQAFQETIKFNKQCDFEGSFKVEMEKFFPVNLKVKGYPNYTRLITNIKMKIDYTPEPTLRLNLKDTLFKGKKDLFFDMEYAVVIDPLSEKLIKKDLGGKITIKRHGKNKVKRTIKLKAK